MIRNILSDLSDFSVDYKNREIHVHRYYNNTDDCDIENKISSMFIKNLRALDSNKTAPILIHFNAGNGGEWTEGIAMYDAIKFCSSYITVVIYGHACSMSSIIPQAADYRIMMPNAFMMCHYGFDYLNDHHINNKKYFVFSEKIRETMIRIYADRMKKGEFLIDKEEESRLKLAKKFIEKKMNAGDWYLTPEDCLYYGLIDDIMGSETCKNFSMVNK